MWYTQQLLTLVVQDSTQPLQNALALQQLSWATSSFQGKPVLKAMTHPFTTSTLAGVPYVIRAQRQWLESAWKRDGSARVRTSHPQ